MAARRRTRKPGAAAKRGAKLYHAFIRKHMKAGMTFKQALALYKSTKKKATKKPAKRKARKSTKRRAVRRTRKAAPKRRVRKARKAAPKRRRARKAR